MFRLHQTADYGNCWSLDNEKFKTLNPGPDGGTPINAFNSCTNHISHYIRTYMYIFPKYFELFTPLVLLKHLDAKHDNLNSASHYGTTNKTFGTQFMLRLKIN